LNHRFMPRSLRSIVSLAAFSLLPFLVLAQSESSQENVPAIASKTDGIEVAKVGKDVSPPVLIHSSEPKLPKEARKAKLGGQVILKCYVEPDGTTSNVHITDSKIQGANGPVDESIVKKLEDSAIGAVKGYRLKPAMKNGQPVRVELNIVVNFKAG
jgi:TonB family protein